MTETRRTDTDEQRERITLKWGTLKAWNITSAEGRDLLRRYFDLGTVDSAIMQHDTPAQKALICELIDVCTAETVYLDWEGRHVSKDEAKRYVMEYGTKAVAS